MLQVQQLGIKGTSLLLTVHAARNDFYNQNIENEIVTVVMAVAIANRLLSKSDVGVYRPSTKKSKHRSRKRDLSFGNN